MSLGRRIPYSRKLSAVTNLFPTPRDASLFLYPCFFAPRRSRAFYGSQTAQSLFGEHVEVDAHFSDTLDPPHHDDQGLGQSKQHILPHERWPDKKFQQGPSIARAERIPIEWIPKTQKKKSETAQSSILTSDGNIFGLKSLREALHASTQKSLQESFKLRPLTIRRLKADGLRTEKRRGYKRISLHRLNTEKYTGSWSYDWRLAFFELKQHYKDDNSSILEPELFQPHFVGKPPRYYQVRAQDIPRPKKWSPLKFSGHIKYLASSEVTRLMHRHVYGDDTEHKTAVHDAIMLLFEDESLKPFMTPTAFHTALGFFFQQNIVSSVRLLFGLMTELQIPVLPETFNIMFWGAASRRDLHTFTFLLRVMVRRGVSPNAGTWIAFLAVLPNKHAKLLVMRFMREEGLLERRDILKAAVVQVIDVEIASHIAGGQDLAAFFMLMDARYGPFWMSIAAGTRICHALGEKGLVSEAVEVLGQASDRGCRPNHVTMHIFLRHCELLRQLERAVEVLRLFQDRYGVLPTQAEYNILFMMAWRLRQINFCRVVWRVACLEAAVSYQMQALVLQSLMRNTPVKPKTSTERFWKTAGKVIVGIDLDNSPSGWSIMEKLSCYGESGEERETSTELARRILARDLDAARHYMLVGDLTQLLTRATALDSKWWNSAEERNASTLWKIQQAVPVEYRVHTKEHLIPVKRLLVRRVG